MRVSQGAGAEEISLSWGLPAGRQATRVRATESCCSRSVSLPASSMPSRIWRGLPALSARRLFSSPSQQFEVFAGQPVPAGRILPRLLEFAVGDENCFGHGCYSNCGIVVESES